MEPKLVDYYQRTITNYLLVDIILHKLCYLGVGKEAKVVSGNKSS